MNAFRQKAIEFADRQATVRSMTPAEYKSCVDEAEAMFRDIFGDDEEHPDLVSDPRQAIRERTITCCICGINVKQITRAHLARHGLDPDSYRQMCGYDKSVPLVCKQVQKQRRERMQNLRLWERRKNNNLPPRKEEING